MKIEKNSIVSFHYALTDAGGELLASSEGEEPMKYLHGAGSIIPGLEEAMAGHEEGDRFQVSLEPEGAYGEVEPSLVQTVPLEAFQGVESVEPGMEFEVRDEGGNARIVRVVKVEEEAVTIDANHPLAGETLNFDVTVSEVRAATDEEVEHGHAH